MLARETRDGTELVQELALLPPVGVCVARRQGPRQVVPTGLLHTLIVIASGRICFDADLPCRVGKILRQRGVGANYLLTNIRAIPAPGSMERNWESVFTNWARGPATLRPRSARTPSA
jgi:hypothetical protein